MVVMGAVWFGVGSRRIIGRGCAGRGGMVEGRESRVDGGGWRWTVDGGEGSERGAESCGRLWLQGGVSGVSVAPRSLAGYCRGATREFGSVKLLRCVGAGRVRAIKRVAPCTCAMRLANI